MSQGHVVDQLFVPPWVAARIQEKRRREIEEMARQKRLEKDPSYQFEQERARKDTKPVVYQDTSDRHRPIMVVGGGGLWYLDAKEKAARLKEKPNPAKDPALGMTNRNVREDLYVALDRRRRRDTGTRTFIIRNNPVSKESA